ncbi:hypothetical protein JCM11641_004849 [Rhodosporidiobolus odoratus]
MTNSIPNNTLDSFVKPSPKKRPPSPTSSSAKSPNKLPKTTPKRTAGPADTSSQPLPTPIGHGVAAQGEVEEMVLDDSDEDDLVIVEPTPQSRTTAVNGSAKQSPGKRTKDAKPPAPIASIFQKRAPPSPALAAGPASPSAKATGSPKAVKVKAEEDVKPDVKPSLSSPRKNIAIFDTASASSSVASTSTSSATAGNTVPVTDYALHKPLDTPLFSFDPLRDVSFPAPPSPNSTPQIPFAFLTTALLLISSNRSRLAIRLILTNLLRTIIVHSPTALLPALYLLSNRIAPSYEKSSSTELGVGWQVLSKAIKETSGATPQKLKQLSNKLGDPGDIAFEASRSVRVLVRPKDLTCEGVYATLRQIAKLKGTGVLTQKTSLVKKLLLSAQGEQVRFVVRILVANLRIGAVRLSLLTALSRAFCVAKPREMGVAKKEENTKEREKERTFWVTEEERDELTKIEARDAVIASTKAEKSNSNSKGKGKGKATSKTTTTAYLTKPKKDKTPLELQVEERFVKAERTVRRVYARHPNLGHLVEALLVEGGAQGVDGVEARLGVSVGTPVEPMLGSITRSLSSIFTKLSNRPFVSELKADGQRGQIHVWVSSTTSSTSPTSLNPPASSSSSALSTSPRPPGVEDGAGLFHNGEESEGLEGKRVWVRTFSRHLEDMTDKYPDIVGTMAAEETRRMAFSSFSRCYGRGRGQQGIVARSYKAAAMAASPTSEPGQQSGDREQPEPLRNFVLDSEVVAIDPQTGAFKTFQELSYRSKKDVELGDIKVRVGIFAFDLMYLNDESLLSTPLRHRRSLLHTSLPALRPSDPRLAKFEHIPSCESNDPEVVKDFFDECVRGKGEGIMVKLLDHARVGGEGEGDSEGVRLGLKVEEEGEVGDREDGTGGSEPELEEDGSASGSDSDNAKEASKLETGNDSVGEQTKKGRGKGTGKGQGGTRKVLPATYEPDVRAASWLKVKSDYLEGVGDSLDLVPIGAWHGSGRKAGWWSPFLLACYDEENGTYTPVSKILSGFTDAFYKEYKEKYNESEENLLTSRQCFSEVEAGGLRPDIWFKPSEVWEIRGADFTLSPVYPAARSHLGGDRGVSIRFPRFIKVREDKGVENATTAEQLAGMYRKQGEPAEDGIGGGGERAGEGEGEGE